MQYSMTNFLMAFGLIGLTGLTGCSYDRSPESGNYDPNHPGYRYTPAYEMYISMPYEPLSKVADDEIVYSDNGMTMLQPPEGTVPRGKLAYQYPFEDNVEGYERAGKELENPLKANEANIQAGKTIYTNYCEHCHGPKGKSQGSVMANSSYPPPPFGEFTSAYIDTLAEGKMYHTITYGKGAMGSHASQISPEERWQVIHYIDDVLNKIDE